MNVILVANPKGGSGKTTLAVNLAAMLAIRGDNVRLLDLDKQQSATAWLRQRPADLAPVWLYNPEQSAKTQAGWLVIDSPAGLHGKNLERALKLAHRVLVPIAPSIFDMAASKIFLEALQVEKVVRKKRAFVGMVGMRITPRTRATVQLDKFLTAEELPALAHLQETQAYVNSAFEGKSIFDLPLYQTVREREQWQPLQAWLSTTRT
ncbi:MAG: ParA family protein [Burkholderiales bacterium]